MCNPQLQERLESVAVVLCTGADMGLLETRRLILEHAGHTVITARDQRAVIAACQQSRIDVAVIGQSVSSTNKRVISSLVRQHCPGAKILELHQSYQGKEVDDADSWLEVPAGVPQELADCVGELLKRSN